MLTLKFCAAFLYLLAYGLWLWRAIQPPEQAAEMQPANDVPPAGFEQSPAENASLPEHSITSQPEANADCERQEEPLSAGRFKNPDAGHCFAFCGAVLHLLEVIRD